MLYNDASVSWRRNAVKKQETGKDTPIANLVPFVAQNVRSDAQYFFAVLI
jgi:hypothetical protein